MIEPNNFKMTNENAFESLDFQSFDIEYINLYENLLSRIKETDIKCYIFLKSYLNEVNYSLFGSNKAQITSLLEHLNKVEDLDGAYKNLEAFFIEQTGFKSFEKAQPQVSEIHLRIIKKQMEDNFGYITFLKLSNFVIIEKYIEKIKGTTPNLEHFLQQEDKKYQERAENLGIPAKYKEGLNITWESVSSLAQQLRNDFGIIDIKVPFRFPKEQLHFWLKNLHQDLHQLSTFLDIPSTHMAKFQIVLGANSRFGPYSYSTHENTMYLKDLAPNLFVHEWFHHFDYNLGAYLHNIMKPYDIELPLTYWSNLPALEGLDIHDDTNLIFLSEFMKLSISRTPYYMSLTKMDNNNPQQRYWTKEMEMMARGFEVWIYDKMKSKLTVTYNPKIPTETSIYPDGQAKITTLNFWNKYWVNIASTYLKSIKN